MTHAQKYRQKIERRLRPEGDKRKGRRAGSSSKPPPSLPFRDFLYGSLPETTPTMVAAQPSVSSSTDPWAAQFDTSALNDDSGNKVLIAESIPADFDFNLSSQSVASANSAHAVENQRTVF